MPEAGPLEAIRRAVALRTSPEALAPSDRKDTMEADKKGKIVIVDSAEGGPHPDVRRLSLERGFVP